MRRSRGLPPLRGGVPELRVGLRESLCLNLRVGPRRLPDPMQV